MHLSAHVHKLVVKDESLALTYPILVFRARRTPFIETDLRQTK